MVSFLWNIFGVFFILDYDSMCSEMDFTPEKSFSSNYKNFQLLHVTKRSDSGIAEAWKALKMHFWDSSQWDKMCFECRKSHIPLKEMGQNFHICLRSGLRLLTPPPPLMVSLTVKYPVFFTPRLILQCLVYGLNLNRVIVSKLTQNSELLENKKK